MLILYLFVRLVSVVASLYQFCLSNSVFCVRAALSTGFERLNDKNNNIGIDV